MHPSILRFVKLEMVNYLFLFLLISSCNTQTQRPLIPEGAELDLQSIRIAATPSVNNGQPISLDIIYVYTEAALRKLQGFNSKGWFTIRDTDLLDWNGQAKVQGLTIEPGEQIQLTEFPAEVNRTVAIALFANYKTPGLHRYFVVGGSKIAVQMEQFGFSVSGE